MTFLIGFNSETNEITNRINSEFERILQKYTALSNYTAASPQIDPVLFEPQTIKKLQRKPTEHFFISNTTPIVNSPLATCHFANADILQEHINKTPTRKPPNLLSTSTSSPYSPNNSATPHKSPSIERLSSVLSSIKKLTNTYRSTPSKDNSFTASLVVDEWSPQIEKVTNFNSPLSKTPKQLPSLAQNSTPKQSLIISSPSLSHSPNIILSTVKLVATAKHSLQQPAPSGVEKRLKSAAERKLERDRIKLQEQKQKEQERALKMERAIVQKQKIEEENKTRKQQHYQNVLRKGREAKQQTIDDEVSSNNNGTTKTEVVNASSNNLNSSTDCSMDNPFKCTESQSIQNPQSMQSTQKTQEPSIPKTPPASLPEIFSDAERTTAKKQTLSHPLWCLSPELKKLLLQQEKLNIDPELIFGEVKPFNISEVFNKRLLQ